MSQWTGILDQGSRISGQGCAGTMALTPTRAQATETKVEQPAAPWVIRAEAACHWSLSRRLSAR
jgi:hypothetical protein